MRILIATGVYPPESGGPATYSKLLEERLPVLGFRVKVLPFNLVRDLPKLVRHFAYFFTVLRVGKKADVFFAQDPVSVGLPTLMAAWMRRKKFVLKVVGDYAWEQGCQRDGIKDTLDDFQKNSYGFFVELLKVVEHFVARRASRVIVPSEYLAKIVRGWGVRPRNISVIYNGVDFDEVPVAPKVRPDGKTIVTVARLVPWKGITALVDVVAKEKGWSLVIVGDGPERATLEHHAIACGNQDRVHFVGDVSHVEALGWIASSDVFILNSSYEGLSHVLLEALNLGRPIVVTNVGGNPEVVKDNESGLLVPAGNVDALHAALLRVLSDSDFARRLSLGAHKRAEDFSINETVRKTGELLKRI